MGGNPLSGVDPMGLQIAMTIPAPVRVPPPQIVGPAVDAVVAFCSANPFACAVTGAGAVGYGIGTLINPYVQPTIASVIDWCASSMSGTGRWSCTASCNVQVINPALDGKVPSRVTGGARGKTEPEACAEAKRIATQSAPMGTYARHCQCSSCSKN